MGSVKKQQPGVSTQSESDRIFERINSLNENLSYVLSRIVGHRERLLGSHPTADTNEKDKALTSGFIENIDSQLSKADSFIDYIKNEIVKLEKF